jgi:CubicO group peptidase (beta-lactamase class C family)
MQQVDVSYSSGNMIFAYQYNDSSKDIVDNVCSTRCHKELRETFAYDNRWFSVAAYIIEQLSGETFSEFVQNHILKPLGMSRSTFNSKEAEPNAATPSITLDDGTTMQDLPFWFHAAQPGNAWEGPAGLFSTTADMIKWIGYLIKTVNGQNGPNCPKIVSTAILKEVLRPRNITSMQLWFDDLRRGEGAYPEFSAPLYGLGVERYHLQ